MGLARISLTESLGNFQETQSETLRTTWMPFKNSQCSNVLWEHVQIGPCSLSLSPSALRKSMEVSPIGDELFEFAALHFSSLASPVNKNQSSK